MTRDTGGRKRSIRSLRPLLHLCICATALAAAGCQRDHRDRDTWPICALPGATSSADVAWLSPTDQRSVMIGDSVVFTADAWVSAIVLAPDGEGFLVFGDGETKLLTRDEGEWTATAVGTPPARVRAAATDPSGMVPLITGGQTQPAPRQTDASDEPTPWLMGGQARAVLVDDAGEAEVPAAWNPWRLKAGRFAGEDNILVFVYKRSPFDAVARRRPFIFRVVEPDGELPRLEPRWRGSAFSHPFVDADFGDFTGSGDGEIAALEVARDGGRLLTAYHFEGFGLEGLAPTIELPEVADQLVACDLIGDEREELIVRATGEAAAFVAWGLTDEDEPRLVEVGRAAAPGKVIAWTALTGKIAYLRPDGELVEAAF